MKYGIKKYKIHSFKILFLNNEKFLNIIITMFSKIYFHTYLSFLTNQIFYHLFKCFYQYNYKKQYIMFLLTSRLL